MAAEGLPVDRVSNVLIPASRIMRERDEAQAQAADLERRLTASIQAHNALLRSSMRHLRELRDAHEIELADRSDRHVENTARLRSEVDRLHTELRRERMARSDAERARDHYKATHERAKEIAEAAVADKLAQADRSIRSLSGECSDLRNQIEEILAGDAGKDCETCHGTGETTDVEPVHCGGPTNAYYERTVMVDCDCFAGRVPR